MILISCIEAQCWRRSELTKLNQKCKPGWILKGKLCVTQCSGLMRYSCAPFCARTYSKCKSLSADLNLLGIKSYSTYEDIHKVVAGRNQTGKFSDVMCETTYLKKTFTFF